MMNLLGFWILLSIKGPCIAEDWKNLHITYELPLSIPLKGYYPIQLTRDALLRDTNWKLMTSDENLDFFSYDDDPKVAIGFNRQGYISGVRTSYVINDLSIKAEKNGLAFPYTYADKPMYTKAKYWNTDVYYTTVLFASPESIAMGGPNNKNGIFAENIFVKINGKYTQMPRKESDATSQGFTKQGCVHGMGQHYFLGLNKDTECNTLQGVFLLYEDKDLIGVGLIPFGSFQSSKKRVWFENPGVIAGAIIAPNSPTCLGEWLSNYGASSIHLFFNEHPRMTSC